MQSTDGRNALRAFLHKEGETVAFGVKVKLDVEVVGGSKLRSQIQQAVENATQGKPIKIRHLSIDLGRQEAQRISKQLESAIASQDICIKIAKIDASKPVAELKKQLTTMLGGLSITGLKDFLGADGVASSYDKATAAANKLAEAQENVRKRTEEANAALKTLKGVQSTLNTVFKSSTGVGDQSKLDAYITRYRELLVASESAKNMQGDAQAAEVMRITAATVALKQQVDAQLEAEKAAKRLAKTTKTQKELDEEAAAAKERAVKKEANISRQAIQLRQRMNTWIQNNTKAYAANKVEIDSLLSMLQNEAAVSDVALAQIRQRFEEINASAHASGIAGRSFFDTLKAGWAKFGGWSLVTKSMMAAVNAVKDMIGIIIDLDSAMTELKKVTDLTDQAYSQFADRATAIAKRIGASVADTINATADFARLGYNIEEAASLAEAALVYKNVGDGIDDISIATESLISTLKAFGIEADDAMGIVDMFNEVGNNFAISSSGIGDALQRSASALAAAGNTIEESIGLVTAMNSVVQNPESVGTALKTLTMYLRAAKTEAEEAGIETDGMANSVSELRDELKKLTGIDIMIDDDTFKSTYQIMKEIAGVWDGLTDVNRSNVLNLLGGKRNANVISSLITNFEDAEEAMKSAMNSLGSATAENEKYLDSINGKLTVLRASLEELSAKFIDSSLVKGVVDVFITGIGVVNSLVETFGVLPSVIGAATVALNVFGKSFGIFKTIDGKMTAFGQQLFNSGNVIGGIKSGIQESFSSLATFVTTFFSKITDDTRALVAFNNEVQNGATFQDAFAHHMQDASVGAQDMARSIGVGDATLKAFGISATAVTAKTALLTVGMKLLSATLNAIVNFTLSAAISGVINLFTSWSEKQKEIEENAKAAAKAAGEATDAVIDSIESYVELTVALSEGKIAEDEFVKSARDIISTLTTQGETVDELIKKYGSLNDAMLNFSRASLEEAEAGLRVALTNSENALKSAYDGWFDNTITIANNGVFGIEKKIKEALKLSGYNVSVSTMSSRGYTAETGASLILKDAHTIEGVIEQYHELYDIIQLLNTIDGADKTNFYQSVYEEYIRLKDLVDGYNTAVIDLNHNLAAQNLTTVLSNMGVPQTTDKFNALRDALIQACIETNGFVSANGDVVHAAEIAVDALILEQDWALKFSDSIIGVGNSANTASGSLHKFADVLERLQKGYNILAQAEAETANGSGLSVDTISSMVSMLAEGEKITDYLAYENGLIKLNVKQWKARTESMSNENISSIEKQIAELENENAALSQIPEDALVNAEKIEQNTELIAALNEELALYKAIYGEIVNGDPTNLSKMTSDLDGIGSKIKGLQDILKGLEGDTALSAEEMANLALQYEELFGMAPEEYDLTTLEGQRAAIEAIIAAYKAECDAIIQTQITQLEAAKTREDITNEEKSFIDVMIQRLSALMGMDWAAIYGTDETEDATNKYNELSDAVSKLTGASKMLTDMKSGEDYMSTFQEIVDFVAKNKDFSLTDFINGDGSFKDVDETLISKVFDTMLAKAKELDGYTPEIGAKWRIELMQVINGAQETASAFETMSKAMSGIESAGDMLAKMKSGEDFLGTAQKIMEFMDAYEGFSLDDFFNADGTIKSPDDALITKVFDKLIEKASELEGWKPEFAEQWREQFNLIISGASDSATALEKLSNCIGTFSTAANLMASMKSGKENYIDMLQSIVDFVNDNEGFSLTDFINPDGTLKEVTDALTKDVFDQLLTEMSEMEGYTVAMGDMLLAGYNQIIAGEKEVISSAERVSGALSSVASARDFFQQISSGESTAMEQINSAIDLAESLKDTEGNIPDWTDWISSVEDGGATIRWNTNAIRALSDAQVDNAFAATGLAAKYPELIAQIKNYNFETNLAAERAERMSEAYSDMQAAVSSHSDYGGYTQITYDAYQELTDIDKRYATAVEYQNGVMVLNGQKHAQITQQILSETKALAEAEKQAIITSDEYKNLAKALDAGTIDEDGMRRLLDLNVQIQGYDVLAQEIDNATSAYARWVNRRGDDGMDRYSQAMEAFKLINATMNDEKSEYFGRIGREEFGQAVDFVIGEHVEVNTPEFKRGMELAQRYLTEGAEGAANFYDDLVSHGLLDATTGALDTTIAEISTKLGLSEEMVRTMIDRLNEYQTESGKIKVGEPDTSGTEEVESQIDQLVKSLEDAKEYATTLSETPIDIQITDGEAKQEMLNSLSTALETINSCIQSIIASPMSFNLDDLSSAVETVMGYITSIQEVLGESDGLSLDVETGNSENNLSAIQNSANTVKAALDGIVTTLQAVMTNINAVNNKAVAIRTGNSSSLLGGVSSKLSSIISQLQQIKKNSNITVKINEVTTRTSSGSGSSGNGFGSWLSGIFGRSSAGGTVKSAGGKTLVGELGMETVVDPHKNQWYTVGERGAEFVNLPKDAIVFNHKQTAELFGMGRIDSRGDAMASGNAAASLWSNIVNGVKNGIKKAVDTVQSVLGGVAGAVTGAVAGIHGASDPVQGGPSRPNVGSGKKPSSGGGSGGGNGGSGSSTEEETVLEKLKKKYEELDETLQHLIRHQEFLYFQAEKGLNYTGMENSLTEQARLYREIMANASKAVQEMIANGASDTDEELQGMEEKYWQAYETLYDILDQINTMYVDALNEKIDGIQTAYNNLATAADEFNKYGGITVDSFQALIANGVQYLSFLKNVNGQYVINEEAIQQMIAAEKEQLAIEQALSYVKQLQQALADGDGNLVANLVNLTEQLGNSTWDVVYAQAAMLKAAGLSDAQYQQVIANINALQALSNQVITQNTQLLDEAASAEDQRNQDRLDSLDKILDLTQDLIKQEVEDQIDAIEDQIDAYKEIIDLKKESLRASKEENEYAKGIADKTKNIADLQAKIDQLSLDDSREAQAQRAALMKELAEAQSDLADTQSDHSYDLQVDALDRMAEEYELHRQEEIEALENSISSTEKLYQLAIQRISEQWDTLYDDLIAWNYESGSTLQSEIVEAWKQAQEAVLQYGSYVQAVSGLTSATEDGGSGSSGTSAPSTVVATGTPYTPTPTPTNPSRPPANPVLPNVPQSSGNASNVSTPVQHTQKVQVTNGRWNVRTGASTKYKSLGVVGNGTELEYRGRDSGNWFAVVYQGQEAWINKGCGSLRTYHTGGVAGDNPTLKDNEVLSVLEEGELVLTDKMKKAAYKLIDFKDYLEKKLGNAIGVVSAPLPQLPALAGTGTLGSRGVDIGQMNFSPTIRVEINHSGSMTDKDARQYGKTIADTAMNELYEGFRQRGIGKIFGTKPT